MSRLYARAVFIPTLLWNVLISRILGLWNWWDAIDEQLLLGALPFRFDAKRLHTVGVRAVVNTCEEYRGPVEAYAEYGIDQLHLPTVDFTAPSLDAVITAIEYIDKKRAENVAVYVHCKAGRGRSATIVLCWLMHAQKLTPQEAEKVLRSQRRQVAANLASRNVVRQFWEQMG